MTIEVTSHEKKELKEEKYKTNIPTFSNSNLLEFITKDDKNFHNYRIWLNQYDNITKVKNLTEILEIINQLLQNSDSEFFSSTLSPQKLRSFTLVLIEQFHQALKKQSSLSTSVAASNIQAGAFFIRELNNLLQRMSKITPFRTAIVTSMLLEKLLSELARQASIAGPSKVFFNFPAMNLIHHWFLYDRGTLNPSAVSRAIEAMGSLAEENYLTGEIINLNFLITWFDGQSQKKDLKMVQQWLLGMGGLATAGLIPSKSLNPAEINSQLAILAATNPNQHNIQLIQKGYWGFTKLLKKWAISTPELLDPKLINNIFNNLFKADATNITTSVYMLRNLVVTNNYVDSLEIPYPLLHKTLAKLHDGQQSDNPEKIASQIGQTLTAMGEFFRSHPTLYVDITDEFPEIVYALFTRSANIAESYIFSSFSENPENFRDFVRSLVSILYGSSLLGISKTSKDSLVLRDKVSYFLEQQRGLFSEHEENILVSKFALFHDVTRLPYPPFMLPILARCRPPPPKPGTIEAEIINFLKKYGCKVVTQKYIGSFPVDIFYMIQGYAEICEINGSGHHFRNPRLGEFKDFFKSLLLEFISGITVHYFDLTKVNYKVETIAAELFAELTKRASTSTPTPERKEYSKLQFYQFIALRVKKGPLWQKGTADSKVAVGTGQPTSPPPLVSGLNSAPTYVSIPIEEKKKKPSMPLSTPKNDCLPTADQLKIAAIEGNQARVMEIFSAREAPINPHTGQPDRSIFIAALIMAMQALHQISESSQQQRSLHTSASPKTRALLSVIEFLVKSVPKEALNLALNGYSVVGLAEKWKTTNPEFRILIKKRFSEGRSKQNKPAIDWTAKGCAIADSSEIFFADLLKPPSVAPKHQKDEMASPATEKKLIRINAFTSEVKEVVYSKEEDISEHMKKILNYTPGAFIKIVNLAKKGQIWEQFLLGDYYLHAKKNLKEAMYWYELAAIAGCSPAQHNLGTLHGMTTIPNLKESFKWFELAAAQHSPAALTALAKCYLKGKGVSQSITKFLELVTEAAERGEREAQLHLGNGCMYGKYGMSVDFKAAIKWYRLSAEQGDLAAKYNLAIAYNTEESGQKNTSLSIQYLTEAATEGLPQAQFLLGKYYLNGEMGLPKNKNQAKKWLQKAADQDHLEAKLKLAEISAKKDPHATFKVLQKEAVQGNIEACKRLGILFKERKDFNKAKKYLLIAAKAEDPNAQLHLAWLYHRGYALKPGETKNDCIKWYLMAAKNGITTANRSLGVYFAENNNLKEAIPLFRSEAQKDNKEAQYDLGRLLSGDINTLEEAKKWLRRAASRGHSEAEEFYQNLIVEEIKFRSISLVEGDKKSGTSNQEQMISIPDVDPTMLSSLSEGKLFKHAMSLVSQEHYYAAFEVFDDWLRKFPHSNKKATIFFHYAEAQIKAADEINISLIEKALSNFRKVQELKPDLIMIGDKITHCQTLLSKLADADGSELEDFIRDLDLASKLPSQSHSSETQSSDRQGEGDDNECSMPETLSSMPSGGEDKKTKGSVASSQMHLMWPPPKKSIPVSNDLKTTKLEALLSIATKSLQALPPNQAEDAKYVKFNKELSFIQQAISQLNPDERDQLSEAYGAKLRALTQEITPENEVASKGWG